MLLLFFSITLCGAHLWSPLVLNDNLFFVFCITNCFISSVFFQVDSDLHLGSCKKKPKVTVVTHLYLYCCHLNFWWEMHIYKHISPFLAWSRFVLFGGKTSQWTSTRANCNTYQKDCRQLMCISNCQTIRPTSQGDIFPYLPKWSDNWLLLTLACLNLPRKVRFDVVFF